MHRTSTVQYKFTNIRILFFSVSKNNQNCSRCNHKRWRHFQDFLDSADSFFLKKQKRYISFIFNWLIFKVIPWLQWGKKKHDYYLPYNRVITVYYRFTIAMILYCFLWCINQITLYLCYLYEIVGPYAHLRLISVSGF